MYNEPRQGPTGTKRSEGLARMGAGFIWASVAVLLLSMIVGYSFVIVETSGGITEEDFEYHAPDEWRMTVSVSSFGTISGTVSSIGDEFEVKVVVYDDNGVQEDTYRDRTPLTFSFQVIESGDYEIAVVILEDGKTIEDLEIEVSTTTMDSMILCCGGSFMLLLDLGLFITGFIMLMIAIFKRREELYPPPPIQRYRQPPPPPYYGPPQGYQYYPRAPPMYPQFRGPQNEGYLGYEGPTQQARMGYHTDEQGVRRW